MASTRQLPIIPVDPEIKRELSRRKFQSNQSQLLIVIRSSRYCGNNIGLLIGVSIVFHFQIPLEEFQVIFRGEFDIFVRPGCKVQSFTEFDHHCIRIRTAVNANPFFECLMISSVEQTKLVGLWRCHPTERLSGNAFSVS